MNHDLCIIGGGPAGMMAGLLFARAGLRTVVLEKHADFLRDFRGDTVHPSTLQVFDELGMLDELLTLPHQPLRRARIRIAGEVLQVADLTRLNVPAPFIAMMPQWDLLDFIARKAARYPTFSLRQSCAGADLIEEGGRVQGVRTSDGEAIRARLTLACDGRDSSHRAGLPRTEIGAPMDVFWFRVPRHDLATEPTLGYFEAGTLMIAIDRGDYYQCAFVLPKGGADTVRAAGLDAFRQRVSAVGSAFAGVDRSIRSWDDVKLLTVTVDRLECWHRPGFLVIGDAAHAMSPVGGVGINLAVQDAVATANLLAAPMATGADPDPLLHTVRDRRIGAVRLTQGMQRLMQDNVIAPILARTEDITAPPLAVRLLDRIPRLQRIPARLIGMGFRPEHVRSPDASGTLETRK